MSWIIPFEGRHHSGAYNQNFLYRRNNIYVMDNHRSALWCWLDFFKEKLKDVGIFHIDRHSDALKSDITRWVSQASSPKHVTSMDIQTYLTVADLGCSSGKLFRWDNYLSIFLEMYKTEIRHCYYAVYEGDEINHLKAIEKKPWDFPENIEFWLSKGKWILNIDLDYFFYKVDDLKTCMYSDEYLHSFFKAVDLIAERDSEVVITICLSPEVL